METPSPDHVGKIPDFSHTLEAKGLCLVRDKAVTCQVNLGLLCNLACRHCHLSAGPGRRELMDLETVNQVVEFLRKGRFQVMDITGGAPELNPNLPLLIKGAAGLTRTVMLRCNPSALYGMKDKSLIDLLTSHGITLVCSLPALNQPQTDSQRGKGSFDKTIAGLKMLNELGYGNEGTGLVLNLVSNPAGAFMPASQVSAEKRFRSVLAEKWGIMFNELFTFANMPLGRFEAWLKKTGNYKDYLQTLYKGFNACTLEGLMCRSLVSVSWDGYLYDCDFNLAANLPMGNQRRHITEINYFDFQGHNIAVGSHCYACTAGSGFT